MGWGVVCFVGGGGGIIILLFILSVGVSVIILCNKLVLIRLLWSVLVSEGEIRETRDTLPVI